MIKNKETAMSVCGLFSFQTPQIDYYAIQKIIR